MKTTTSLAIAGALATLPLAAPAATEVVLSLLEAQQRFVFEGVPSAPVPSLLRGFSAPVKLNLDCSDAELAFLMGHDDDPFNRWEAGQRLATRILLGAVASFRAGQAIELPAAFIDAFGRTLADPVLDGRFKALALSLPDFTFLGEQMAQVDVEGLHAAREAVVSQLARAHRSALEQAYEANRAPGAYRHDGESIGRRALRNTCLAYLSRAGTPDALALALAQFDSADNMTDQNAALSCIVDVPREARQRALDAFHAQWKADPLVIDGLSLRDSSGRTIYRGPIDLAPTLERIAAGRRLRFPNDGTTFQNRENRLPRRPPGYYREWVVPTPKEPGPGPQRVITGDAGEVWYTSDHYRSFRRIPTEVRIR
jgi:aminopeptidase N